MVSQELGIGVHDGLGTEEGVPNRDALQRQKKWDGTKKLWSNCYSEFRRKGLVLHDPIGEHRDVEASVGFS